MYSYEIQQVLENFRYDIPYSVFDKITNIDTNPQIARIKWDMGDNSYEMWTNDNCYWKFRVH